MNTKCDHDPKFLDPRSRIPKCLICELAKAEKSGWSFGKTRTITVAGLHSALLVSTDLIRASKWFNLTPLPDDMWEFTVKDEPGLPDLSDPSIIVVGVNSLL